jgi:hypothetical protein
VHALAACALRRGLLTTTWFDMATDFRCYYLDVRCVLAHSVRQLLALRR